MNIRKILYALSLSLLIFNPINLLSATSEKQSENKKASTVGNLFQTLTATKTRKTLLGIGALYTIHRTIQSYSRSKAIKNLSQSIGQEAVIANPKGIVTLFAHGLGGDSNHGIYYKDYGVFYNDSAIAPERRLHIFDFQDSPSIPNQQPSCLAQDADVFRLKQEYDKLVAQGFQVNLHGVSRGASTILNFLAICQPKNVRCAIVESPFDDIETIVHDKLKVIKYIPIVGSMISALTTFIITRLPLGLQNYSVYGINPIDCISKISQDIPLLFIASKEDSLIPHESTSKLVNSIKNNGHRNCYSLVVDQGPHGNILNSTSSINVIGTIKKFIANPNVNPIHEPLELIIR